MRATVRRRSARGSIASSSRTAERWISTLESAAPLQIAHDRREVEARLRLADLERSEAGGVFGYYLTDLRAGEREAAR